jgi:hypothetical protein
VAAETWWRTSHRCREGKEEGKASIVAGDWTRRLKSNRGWSRALARLCHTSRGVAKYLDRGQRNCVMLRPYYKHNNLVLSDRASTSRLSQHIHIHKNRRTLHMSHYYHTMLPTNLGFAPKSHSSRVSQFQFPPPSPPKLP